jgi:hypothetical protein
VAGQGLSRFLHDAHGSARGSGKVRRFSEVRQSSTSCKKCTHSIYRLDAHDLSESDGHLLSRFCEQSILARYKQVHTKQLFWTEDDRFGITDAEVKSGDVLCVFSGAPVVHILRRAEGTPDYIKRWRLVGDAYVHGLMYDDFFSLDIEEQEFCLV